MAEVTEMPMNTSCKHCGMVFAVGTDHGCSSGLAPQTIERVTNTSERLTAAIAMVLAQHRDFGSSGFGGVNTEHRCDCGFIFAEGDDITDPALESKFSAHQAEAIAAALRTPSGVLNAAIEEVKAERDRQLELERVGVSDGVVACDRILSRLEKLPSAEPGTDVLATLRSRFDWHDQQSAMAEAWTEERSFWEYHDKVSAAIKIVIADFEKKHPHP